MRPPRLQSDWRPAWIGLGSNLGNKKATLESAVEQIARQPQCEVRAVSSAYLSKAIGPGPQPDFLNAAMRVATRLNAEDLLALLLAIERQHGRQRRVRWAARTLDLDLLLYDELEMQTQHLTLPHPRLHERPFVVIPLLEIDPELQLPARRGPIGALKERFNDTDLVEKVFSLETSIRQVQDGSNF